MSAHDASPGNVPIVPLFAKTCAGLGIAGLIVMIVSNLAGALLVPGYDIVSDTISDLGAGRYNKVQDVGFYAFAAALLAMTMGLSHDHGGTSRWTSGILLLALLAGVVVVIGARNEYGDGDSGGVVIHMYLVYALAVLILGAALALLSGLREWGRGYWRGTAVFVVLWCIGVPVYFALPTSIDGAWERGLGLLSALWLGSLCVGLWRRAG